FSMLPTGRTGAEWRKWNPHVSLHRDGGFHHKSYDRKLPLPKKVRAPDAGFKGSLHVLQRPSACHEPRSFGVMCDPAEFSDVMEIPIGMLSQKEYETYVSVDFTDAHGAPSFNTSEGQILAQHAFKDALPWILVSAVFKPMGAASFTPRQSEQE